MTTDAGGSVIPGIVLRQWRWPMPRVYNGFSPEERVLNWQVMWWLIENGHLPHPRTCSMTGLSTGERAEPKLAELLNAGLPRDKQTDQVTVGYHAETYYDPFAMIPIAHAAHRLLHRRFFDPRPWQALVAHCRRTGEEWFAKLELHPVDLAARLRTEHGASASDIIAPLERPTGRELAPASIC